MAPSAGGRWLIASAAVAAVLTSCSSNSVTTTTASPSSAPRTTSSTTTLPPTTVLVTEAPVTTQVAEAFPVKKDDTGFGAMRVQQMLLAAGYDPTGVDGIFGNYTVAAVKAFQQDQQLDTTGTVDRALWERLAEAESQAPACTREALYSALQEQLGTPDFSLDEFQIANAKGCAPGWAIASHRVSGRTGTDTFREDLFLFRVRGTKWVLVSQRSGDHTVTNQLVKGSPLTWFTFDQLFGQPGWPANATTADDVARYIFVDVFNEGLSPGAIRDVVDMWLDSNGMASFGDFVSSWTNGMAGTLSRCEKQRTWDPLTEKEDLHWVCDWDAPDGSYWQLHIDNFFFSASMVGPYSRVVD
jgi:hypothetical protein